MRAKKIENNAQNIQKRCPCVRAQALLCTCVYAVMTFALRNSHFVERVVIADVELSPVPRLFNSHVVKLQWQPDENTNLIGRLRIPRGINCSHCKFKV